MEIKIPLNVKNIIQTLQQCGFEAYAVGGCVRDILLGANVADWDICTSALPQQIIDSFPQTRVCETGLKHGTVTLVMDGNGFEITTFRIDGEYRDNRRPESVEFVTSIESDLARRDFTVNAMAYNDDVGLVDRFGGVQDLKQKVIRCVGDPDARFNEDALRIMRGLRFASVLGFSIDKNTASSMERNKSLLKNISPERISRELSGLICGNKAGEVMAKAAAIIEEIIPEIAGKHNFLRIDHAPKDLAIRLAILLGKDAKSVLRRLKYDNRTITEVGRLVKYSDADLEANPTSVKRWLNKLGAESLRRLVILKQSDNINDIISEILEQGQCFSLSGLAVNGKDLIEAGIPQGPQIKAELNRLLDCVIDGTLENNKYSLLAKLK